MIDSIIAYHCAPALAGIKPANIFSCSRRDYPHAERELHRLNSILNSCGIYFEILCSCEKRIMVMMYRKTRLEEYINRSEIRILLNSFGYPSAGECGAYIEHLKSRILESTDFPHEIGAFLGYPIHDIYGFMLKKEKCLYTGYWKVYDDLEASKKCFKRYDMCRAAVMKRIDGGSTIESLFGRKNKKCA